MMLEKNGIEKNRNSISKVTVHTNQFLMDWRLTCRRENIEIYFYDFKVEMQGLVIESKYFTRSKSLNECLNTKNFYSSKDSKKKMKIQAISCEKD